MTVQLGSGIKPAKGAKLEAKFAPVFGSQEELLLLIKSSNFRFDHVAVTTERVIGCMGQTTFLATFPVELSLSTLLSIRLDFAKRSAELSGAGKNMKLKMLHPDDLALLGETFRTLQAGGAPVEVEDNQDEVAEKRAAGRKIEQSEEATARSGHRSPDRKEEDDGTKNMETKSLTGSTVFGGRLKKQLRVLGAQGWTVVSSSGPPELTTVILQRVTGHGTPWAGK